MNNILEEMEEIKKCVKYVRNLRNKHHISKNRILYFIVEDFEVSDTLNNIFLKLANFKIVKNI